jgi:hypothetical protein
MATPLTWIEAPTRQPRPNTSLDVIPVHDVSSEHFVGYQYMADPCGFPSPLPKDCYIQYGPAAGTPKGFEDLGDPVITDVFGAYQGIECFLNGGIDDFRELAQRMLENGEHRIVDGRIVGLLGGATATTPPSVGTIAGALGLLEQYLALEIPGQGYIYMGPVAATYAASDHLLIRNLDGTLETYLGTPVIVLTEPSAAGTIWASGPINLWRGPVEVNSAPGWTDNMGRALAERLYTLSIECGAWKTTFTAPAGQQNPPDEPDEPLEMNLGSIPSSPIPDGTDVTIIVQTNVTPENEVILWYSVNGDPAVEAGEMTETGSHEYVWNVVGDSTTTGDSVEVWAISEFDGADVESNHITIEVT